MWNFSLFFVLFFSCAFSRLALFNYILSYISWSFCVPMTASGQKKWQNNQTKQDSLILLVTSGSAMSSRGSRIAAWSANISIERRTSAVPGLFWKNDRYKNCLWFFGGNLGISVRKAIWIMDKASCSWRNPIVRSCLFYLLNVEPLL